MGIKIDFNSVSPDIIGLCAKWFHTDLTSAQFVFDSFGVDASRMQIINARTVKCLKMGDVSAYGGSIRLKCALPTKSNANGVRSVFWECVPNKLKHWSSTPVSLGVVSNRTNSFVNAFNGLKDAYGVGINPYGAVYKGNLQNKTHDADVIDID